LLLLCCVKAWPTISCSSGLDLGTRGFALCTRTIAARLPEELDCPRTTGYSESWSQLTRTARNLNRSLVVKRRRIPESRSLIVGVWSATRKLSAYLCPKECRRRMKNTYRDSQLSPETCLDQSMQYCQPSRRKTRMTRRSTPAANRMATESNPANISCKTYNFVASKNPTIPEASETATTMRIVHAIPLPSESWISCQIKHAPRSYSRARHTSPS
jgi:hypothetical protein